MLISGKNKETLLCALQFWNVNCFLIKITFRMSQSLFLQNVGVPAFFKH